MKKFDAKISTMISKLCAFLLALMGFSCSSLEGDDEGEMLLMYGCPTGSYEIKGKVVDENNNAISDAIIRITQEDTNSDMAYLVADTTDTSGLYEVEHTDHPFKKLKVVCIPSDKTFLPDSTIVNMEYKKNDGESSSWYKGRAEATVDFTLKKKPTEE